MPEPIQEYAQRIPLELRLAVSGLDGQNDLRYAIVAVLLEDEDIAFSQLREKLEVHQQSLTNGLDALERGGVISQIAANESSDFESYYTLSKFGEDLLENLKDTISSKYKTPIREEDLKTHPRFDATVVTYYDTEVREREQVANKEAVSKGQSYKTAQGRPTAITP